MGLAAMTFLLRWVCPWWADGKRTYLRPAARPGKEPSARRRRVPPSHARIPASGPPPLLRAVGHPHLILDEKGIVAVGIEVHRALERRRVLGHHLEGAGTLHVDD